MDPIATALKVAASGLHVQSERLRVVSENLANAQSTGRTPGGSIVIPSKYGGFLTYVESSAHA